MSDLRIQYNEEMVGQGHPTKADTLNRLFLGGPAPVLRDSDGKVLHSVFKKQTSPPDTGVDEGALYAKEDAAGELKLYWRRPSNGEEMEVGGGLVVVDQGSTPWTPAGAGYQTATLPFTQPLANPEKCAISFAGAGSFRQTGGSAVVSAQVTINIEDETHFRVRAYVGAAAATTICYQVWQAITGQVRRGVYSLTPASAGPLDIDVTIDAISDYTKALILSGNVRGDMIRGTGSRTMNLDEIKTTSNTNLKLLGYASDIDTYYIPWQIYVP
ncbi:hypothetical protein AAU61_02095 [Desulfocarbo indianensis]|nr:hypothetical protein AAU61_02095 [Desulfocarbo indianensis]